ncbi:phenylacetate-CoA oxygenase subunit PaaJ [Sphingomonas deserti]|uniref:Phenylacetate-CoA oxygenase subunit PaaJ n=1 Tax=Allosphingosinicella deserti TaxID=2116704 RepID=A0A2P7QNV2_9SPHN|nr:1,2-phenylacetyl-CoA epoxidase subunit PaaD [Sphingomonas deserti]PSJ39636.1 phenylacetate-CoA oxygenase subunit PaaJ [Sphingomonas deserti]
MVTVAEKARSAEREDLAGEALEFPDAEWVSEPPPPSFGRSPSPCRGGSNGSDQTDGRRVAAIAAVVESVADPEIPVLSIVDLGIVRAVEADRVVLTPTYTGCPATHVIERDVRDALDAAGYRDVRIDTVLSPAWTTDWITPEGRARLHAYGIAPPDPEGRRVAVCPQCGSRQTEEISRFGSTPCKALWRCRDCAEPFDLFKCH